MKERVSGAAVSVGTSRITHKGGQTGTRVYLATCHECILFNVAAIRSDGRGNLRWNTIGALFTRIASLAINGCRALSLKKGRQTMPMRTRM